MSNFVESISLLQAQNLAIQAQYLQENLSGISGTLKAIQHLGYIQIDAISVIARAHHHILWTRIPDYQSTNLNQLLKRRQIFEYWGHAASYLPLTDYPYYLGKMEKFITQSRWAQKHYSEVKTLFPAILKRIADEGPLKASDFKSDKRQNPGWWSWKPAKLALEFLYWQGELMVCQRDNFHKVYELRSRFLPADVNLKPVSAEELANFCLQRALKAHGIMTFPEIQRHLPLSPKSQLQNALEAQIASHEVIPVRIQGLPLTYYVPKNLLNQPMTPKHKGIHILSPFDNFIIQRDRLKHLFQFEYLLECYVPEAKRRFGYLSLPILSDHQIIAQIDLKAERNNRHLEIRNIHYAKALNRTEKTALKLKLQAFAKFNDCQSVSAF